MELTSIASLLPGERVINTVDSRVHRAAKRRWNAGADQYNQWDALGQDEKEDLIRAEKERQTTVAQKQT